MLVTGVDGCKGGWVLVTAGEAITAVSVVRTFTEVLSATADHAAVAVDMPIGLPEIVGHGGRRCDREARALLSPHGSRVFPSPARAALGARDYQEAQELNKSHSEGSKGLPQQAFAIIPKIVEVDREMTSALQERVFEVHPEVCFYHMNGGRVVRPSKKSAAGVLLRLKLLDEAGLLSSLLTHAEDVAGAAFDDVLDAAAAAWTARRHTMGDAVRLPQEPPLDARELRMEMWA